MVVSAEGGEGEVTFLRASARWLCWLRGWWCRWSFAVAGRGAGQPCHRLVVVEEVGEAVASVMRSGLVEGGVLAAFVEIKDGDSA